MACIGLLAHNFLPQEKESRMAKALLASLGPERGNRLYSLNRYWFERVCCRLWTESLGGGLTELDAPANPTLRDMLIRFGGLDALVVLPRFTLSEIGEWKEGYWSVVPVLMAKKGLPVYLMPTSTGAARILRGNGTSQSYGAFHPVYGAGLYDERGSINV